MLIEKEIVQNGHELHIRPTKVKAKEQEIAINQYENGVLSIIVRCHRPERLPFLEEAMFSLSIQEWVDIEVVVVVQNGTDEFVEKIKEIIHHQPWQKEPKYQIHSIQFEDGFDGRSSLLNYGINYSIGRYLAFLDDDDVVYHHGYNILINKLEEDKGAAIAIGGCRVAKTSNTFDNWYIDTKETPFTGGRNRYDLYRDNFIPIHSYVIDRKVVAPGDLYFDDQMPPLEDYDFLLRLGSKYEFDFSNLDTFVCEYRIHNSNSLPYTAHATQEQITKHQRAYHLIEERKKSLSCLIPMIDIIAIKQPETQNEDFRTSLVSNPQIFHKILILFVNKVYSFFRGYPTLEKRLSNLLHYLWDKYQK